MAEHANRLGPAPKQAYVNDAIDELTGKLTHIRGQVESATHRVSRTVDRVVGTEPDKLEKATTPPRPGAEPVELLVRDIEVELNELFRQLDRLQR